MRGEVPGRTVSSHNNLSSARTHREKMRQRPAGPRFEMSCVMMNKLLLPAIAVGLIAAVGGLPLPPVIETPIDTGSRGGRVVADACQQPMTKGPCEALFTRYFYNPQTSTCEQFDYGGCWGNDNNFASLQLCQETCMSVE
ncbi:kunitz-type serine protease inhibitor nigrescinin-2-like [Mercenaria mercenaria]|uniref:kunitz-type serine protease inhibitor nigrescinin-2-like n=1 Tax=Mercenaria mercenaria TaxID=6596 RepID=UPI00234F915C|nr:kunitz-type serine protease inhibitor nigrescinin-2-like [Mercenaria mercenaria]